MESLYSERHQKILSTILKKFQDQSIPESSKSDKETISPEKEDFHYFISRTPKDIPTLLINANLLIQHGEDLLATHLIRQVLYINPHHPQALKQLEKLFEKRKKSDETLKVLEQRIQGQRDFETLIKIAKLYYDKDRDTESLNCYHEALSCKKTPDQIDTLFTIYKNMGNIYCRSRDFDGAEEFYNRAYTLCPNSGTLLVNMGTLAVQREDYNKAKEVFKKAIEVQPKNDKAWVGLAAVHNKLGDVVLSLANIETALDLNPLNRTALQFLSHWSAQMRLFQKPIPYLQHYLGETEVLDSEMSALLIHLFLQRQEYALAELEVERFLLWNPYNVEMARVEEELKKMKKNKSHAVS